MKFIYSVVFMLCMCYSTIFSNEDYQVHDLGDYTLEIPVDVISKSYSSRSIGVSNEGKILIWRYDLVSGSTYSILSKNNKTDLLIDKNIILHKFCQNGSSIGYAFP